MQNKTERAERAQIFQSFDSLKGFKEYIKKKERIVVKRKHLAEDYCQELDRNIHLLKAGMMVRVIYYDIDEYVALEGMVSKIDLEYDKTLVIVDTCIGIHDIVEITLL